MITMPSLRTILKTIYGVDDKYLIPLSQSWFVPTINRDDKIGTWIGYRILNKKPNIRGYQADVMFVIPIQLRFRMAFVGPQAEEFADQTLLWDNRTDVKEAFETCATQLNYNGREIFSYPLKNEGFNDSPSWIVDVSAQTTYEVDTKQKPWLSR